MDLDILNDCIDRLAAGQTIDDCLVKYARYAEELKPVLLLSTQIKSALPAPSEVRSARQRVYARLEPEFAQPTTHRAIFRQQVPVMRYTMRLAAVLLMAFFATGLLAQDSLPGDPLYSTKRLTEELGLALTGQAPAVQTFVQQRRIDEALRLTYAGREAVLDLSGKVNSISENELVIEGLRIRIRPETPLGERFFAGDQVALEIQSTSDGLLVMRHMRLINRTEPPVSVPVIPPTSIPGDLATPTPVPTFTDSPLTPTIPTKTSTMTATILRPTIQRAPTEPGASQATECVVSPQPGWYRYEVQSGDTLSGIALRAGTSVDEIVQVNCIQHRARIIAGQFIYLPRLLLTPFSTLSAAAPVSTPGSPTTPRLENDTGGSPDRTQPPPTGGPRLPDSHGGTDASNPTPVRNQQTGQP